MRPTPGTAATILRFTDRHAATVEKTRTWCKGQLVAVRKDRATRTDRNGPSEDQSYTYERDESGQLFWFWLGPDATRWREVYALEDGRFKLYPKRSGAGLVLGVRESYYDYST